jgi:hypothetical protein
MWFLKLQIFAYYFVGVNWFQDFRNISQTSTSQILENWSLESVLIEVEMILWKMYMIIEFGFDQYVRFKEQFKKLIYT